MALGRLSKSRGGTPTGERVPLDARRIRRCGSSNMRLSAFRLPRFLLRKQGEQGGMSDARNSLCC